MIRLVTFYRLSLAAPMVVPLVAAGLGFAMPALFGVPAVLIGGSLMFTWWSYPLFAIGVLAWSRRRTARELAGSSAWLPLIYAPLCGAQMATVYGRPFSGGPVGWWDDFTFGLLAAVVVGYAYVLCVLLVGRLLSDSRGTAEGRRTFISPGT